jgi:hypothetical protein
MKYKIYVIKCYNNNERFIKLGFTKYTVKTRFQNMPYRFKVLRVVYNTDSKLIETSIHRAIKDKRFKPSRKFPGYTECYPMSMFKEINRLINDFCGIEHKPKKKKQTPKQQKYLNHEGKLDYVDLSMYRF